MILLGFNLDFCPRLCIAGTWPSLAHAVVAVALLVGQWQQDSGWGGRSRVLCSNYTASYCCPFSEKQHVRQIHDRSTGLRISYTGSHHSSVISSEDKSFFWARSSRMDVRDEYFLNTFDVVSSEVLFSDV